MDLNSKFTKNNKNANRFLPLAESVSNGQEEEAKITDFIVTKSLGKGSFGKVELVTHKVTGGVYAIKSIDKRDKNNQEGKPYFRREIEIMYKVHHPNIVKLYSHFEDDEFCYFVMEYVAKGNLFSIMSKQKNKCFDAKLVANYIKDLTSAVYFLHSMDPAIVHRDIKPENILLTDKNELKLTDFGWSNYINNDSIRSTYCGTPVYLAPEMIKAIGHDEHIDIWCIGVLMFELLTGDIPFPGNDMKTLSDNILKTRVLWPKDIDPNAKDLIKKILKPDPKDRISLVDILKHPFITKYTENPTQFLFKPSDVKETDRPFMLSKDVPSTFANNNEDKSKKKKENIAGQVQQSQQIQQPDTYDANAFKNFKTYDSANITKIISESDMNSNIKELYDKLKSDYESLMNSYNSIVVSKSEMSKKIEELAYKEKFFYKEKESLLKELEEKDNEKLALQKTVAESNQKIIEKENKLKILTRNFAIFEERKLKDEQEINRLNGEVERLYMLKDEEAKEFRKQIDDLQLKLVNGVNLENHMSTLRQSISGMNERLNFIPFGSSSGSSEDVSEYKKKLENELKETKEFLSKEIENLKKESAKEREKYLIIVKNKEDDIKKLAEEKIAVRENEAKKYEKILNKYEITMKLRESEIESLKLKIKKLENIMNKK